MPEKSLMKIICLCSLIFGAIIGLIPLIPALIWAAFLIIMFFSAPFVIIYLRKLELIENISSEQNMLIGSISGAVSFIGFSIIYFPLALLLYVIFKIEAFLWIKVAVTNIAFLLMTIILTALLSALLNTFSALLTDYFYTIFNRKK